MSRDYNRFRILYSLYDKHYNINFEWQSISLLYREEDLRYISDKSFYGDLVYLKRKKFIEGLSPSHPNEVRIRGEGIDVIDFILSEYLRYLGNMTDEESRYEYRHLSAMGDEDDILRSQMYYYVKQRKSLFKHFLLISNIFRKTTFPDISNSHSIPENRNNTTNSEIANSINSSKRWDAFISHASEDKDSVARPLYDFLTNKCLHIWYDEFTLKVGDSLRRSIDYGLSRSVCGIVVLSKDFFIKEWPQHELNGLFAIAMNTRNKIILPIWHNITKADVLRYSPMLADKVALSTQNGMENIGKKLEEEIRRLKVA